MEDAKGEVAVHTRDQRDPPNIPPYLLSGGHIDQRGVEVDWPPCLPQANVLKISKQDQDLRMEAKQATAVKTKACDLFARQLAWEAMEVMPALRNTLTEDALLAAIMNQDSPLFLVRDFDSDQDVDEKKRNLPVANIYRLMKKPGVLPDDAKVSESAKKMVARCVKEFICVITSEASDRVIEDRRATVTANDVLHVLSALGFGEYVGPIEEYMQRLPIDIFHREKRKAPSKEQPRECRRTAAKRRRRGR